MRDGQAVELGMRRTRVEPQIGQGWRRAYRIGKAVAAESRPGFQPPAATARPPAHAAGIPMPVFHDPWACKTSRSRIGSTRAAVRDTAAPHSTIRRPSQSRRGPGYSPGSPGRARNGRSTGPTAAISSAPSEAAISSADALVSGDAFEIGSESRPRCTTLPGSRACRNSRRRVPEFPRPKARAGGYGPIRRRCRGHRPAPCRPPLRRRPPRCRRSPRTPRPAPAAAPSLASDRAKQLASLASRTRPSSALSRSWQRLAVQVGGVGVLDHVWSRRFRCRGSLCRRCRARKIGFRARQAPPACGSARHSRGVNPAAQRDPAIRRQGEDFDLGAAKIDAQAGSSVSTQLMPRQMQLSWE